VIYERSVLRLTYGGASESCHEAIEDVGHMLQLTMYIGTGIVIFKANSYGYRLIKNFRHAEAAGPRARGPQNLGILI